MVTVTAAIILEDNKVLIARRKRGEKLAGYWEFPGGKMKKKEDPRDCLQRELGEELNLNARVGVKFAESIYSYKHMTIKLIAFITHIQSDINRLSLSVHDKISWVSPAELDSYNLAPADIPIAEKLKNGKLFY